MSDDSMLALVPERISGEQGNPYPQEIRDRAFSLWAWTHRTNCAAVARELGLEPRTVQLWAKHEDWRARRAELFRREALGIHEDNVIELVNFTPEMIRIYIDIAKHGRHETSRIAANNALAQITGYLALPGKDKQPLMGLVAGHQDQPTNQESPSTPQDHADLQRRTLEQGRR